MTEVRLILTLQEDHSEERLKKGDQLKLTIEIPASVICRGLHILDISTNSRVMPTLIVEKVWWQPDEGVILLDVIPATEEDLQMVLDEDFEKGDMMEDDNYFRTWRKND